jgi:hypothetical protein
VIGVMAPKGEVLGFDLDDVAWVPTATAMRRFDLEQLAEATSRSRAATAPTTAPTCRGGGANAASA